MVAIAFNGRFLKLAANALKVAVHLSPGEVRWGIVLES
jgi:hypothetical protein